MPKNTITSLQSKPDEIGSYVSTLIPTCGVSDNLEFIVNSLIENSWDDMDYIFVLDAERKILGFIDAAKLSQTDKTLTAGSLMTQVSTTLKLRDKKQKALIAAVRHDADIIPVIDDENRFLGAIISKTIIDLMHAEHLENVLLTSGLAVKKHQVFSIATARLYEVVKYRLPWLLLGLLAGLGLGLISSRFEKSLQENIAIAYFIPVIAYIADSVGTQSEAIAVRSLATIKVKTLMYLVRELLIGIIIGMVIGIMGGLGAYLISLQLYIGVVVGISLFAASTIAAVLGSTIPIIFKALDKDPALASGPIATALQDIISVLIYFLFATWLL